MAITPDDKKISQFPVVTPADAMFVPLIDLTQIDPALRNVRASIAAILALVPSSGGTVTDFSAGDLSPLFTTSVATSTSTPALSFSLTTHSANLVFAGPTGGGAAAPTFRSLVADDIPNLTSIYQPLDADLTAIAALGTTAYGRGFLTQVDASAARTYIGAGTGSGSVTSVNLTQPAAGITVSGGPITTSGSITLALADDLAALEALSGTDTIYYRSGVSTWTPVTIGTNLLFSGGTLSASAPGTGTVTSFSAGNLSPLFTTNVATATTTPALTFTLSNQSANLVFSGPTNGAAAAPTFRALVAADIPDLSAVYDVAGSAATAEANANTYTDGEIAGLSSVYQPLNANLTSISALTTTSYGLGFLELANAAAARTYIGAGTGSGTVTSVGLTMPSGFSVGGSPVTTSGTLAVTTTLSGLVVGDGSGLIARTATGTADRISITNGSGVAGNPTFDIAATYVGQTSITTLGTIATGTWSATTIAASRGGTGQTTYADGDLLYGLSGGLAKLAHPGLLNNILVTSFFGGLSWVDIGVVATTTVTGTANQVLVNGGSGTGVTGAITLTLPQSIGTASNVQFGSINSTPIGATTPSTGAFTIFSASNYGAIGTSTSSTVGLRVVAPSAASNQAITAIENAGVHQINIRPNYDNAGGGNLIQSDYLSGSTYLPLLFSARGVATDFVLATNGSASFGVGINATTIGATTPSTGAFTGVTVAPAGALGNITLGDGTSGSYSTITMRGNASQTAWQIASSNFSGSTLEFTPSTAAGGTTFTTPVVKINSTGLQGAIGATTPSTGVFTSLNTLATGGVMGIFDTSNANGGYFIYRTNTTSIGDIGAELAITGSGSSGDFMVTSRAGDLLLGQNDTVRGRVTSTGLNAMAIGATTPSTIRGTKLIGGGTTPGVSVGAGAGSGASANISGSDAAVRITLTTGTGTSSGLLFTVTFASAFAVAPKVVFAPCESASADLVVNCQPYIIRNTTIFEFHVVNPPSDGTDYPFDFVIIG